MGCSSSSHTKSLGPTSNEKEHSNDDVSTVPLETKEIQPTTQRSETNPGVILSGGVRETEVENECNIQINGRIVQSDKKLEDCNAERTNNESSGNPKATEVSGEQENAGGESDSNKEECPTVNDQERFNTAIRCACELVNSDSVLQYATDSVTSLSLHSALPYTISLSRLLVKLPNLQEVDISGNNIGPQGFRAIMLGLCNNNSITSLNISNNMADTDSSECIGKMLSTNKCLEVLDVSGNHLGKDYFSRCVGPALISNDCLRVLRCESIGATDLRVLAENCVTNSALIELNISHNDLQDSTQLVRSICNWLQFENCNLTNLIMKNCGLKSNDLSLLAVSLNSNTSLTALNVSSNQTNGTSILLDLLVSCILQCNIVSLTADDIKFKTETITWEPRIHAVTKPSKLSSLSLSGCQLCDQHFDSLKKVVGPEVLTSLNDVNLNKNPSLTMNSISHIIDLTMDDCGSALQRLSWALNSADGVSEMLNSRKDSVHLQYLNIRKSKITATEIGKISTIAKKTKISNPLEALVLDGIKLSGSSALNDLLASEGSCSLVALSLSGCSLADMDLQPLAEAIKQNIPLTMLKLSANRITDEGIRILVDALLYHDQHCLQLIDFMNNKITDAGAKKLVELFTSNTHETKIHSLNLNNNNIGPQGVATLVSLIQRTCLVSLQVCNQQYQYEEEDMDVIVKSLIEALGGDTDIESGSNLTESFSIPALMPSISVKLAGLGGNPGELGRKIDSVAFPTDTKNKKLPYLTFQHALQLAAAFKGQSENNEGCVLSQEEWKMITSADKESPSWLQLNESRERCVYLSHLPASITVQKMEAVLEMEADCNVQEVFLLKDPVFRKNTGFAWVLLADTLNVERAVQFMNDGQAQVYSQPFIISKVCAHINDEANSKYVAAAREDLLKRVEHRKMEEVKHRALIRQSYAESQARHAYRLAHPAYADGRIW